jgi:predicted dehydrogenase
MDLISREDYFPTLSAEINPENYGIGVIGCGEIVNMAHLPAYRKAGFKVVGCCDVNNEAAKATAEKFNIPFYTTNVSDLLCRDDVKIIDIAVHPKFRFDILLRIVKAPRPVLCQKPLGSSLEEAIKLGETARAFGIKMAVNQQARWAPVHKAMRILVDRGAIGEVYNIQHEMRSFQDQKDKWWIKVPDFTIMDHGIHYFDLCRFFASSPFSGRLEWERLHCSTSKLPDQNSSSPMNYAVNVEFENAKGMGRLIASLQFNNVVRANKAHSYCWRLDGTEGSIWGDYSNVYLTNIKSSSTITNIAIEGSWFPDAFIGSMADLIEAVETGKEPETSPENNYNSLAMAEASVISSREAKVVNRNELFKL